MPKRLFRTLGLAFLVPLGAIALDAGSASAARHANPPFSMNFPAGQACSFALDISGSGGNSAVRHSSSVTTITGGAGSALAFSGNGKTVSFPSNGAASVTRQNPDGSSTVQLTGHNIVILFPTDNPPGPSTTLIVGREVINISAAGAYDVQSVSGMQTDICALLT